MDTQLICGACGNVIPDEESVYAIRVKQVVHAICEICKQAIPKKGRVPLEDSGMSGRSSMNQNVIEIHIAMRNPEKEGGIKLGETRLKVSKKILQTTWPTISFNSTGA